MGTIAGVKYLFVRGDPDCVIAKKGSSGVVIHKCKSCLIVSYHGDNIQSGACNDTTAKLAEFLKENGILSWHSKVLDRFAVWRMLDVARKCAALIVCRGAVKLPDHNAPFVSFYPMLPWIWDEALVCQEFMAL